MKRITYLFVLFALISGALTAQRVSLSGIITSKEDGLPIIGASVLEKGTTNGTISNFDGAYSLSVNRNATIVFSYVGMETLEMKVPASGPLNVVMSSASLAIDEVVVTAMGVKQEKKKLNFAVQSVTAEAITDSRSANFVSSLQGKISGVSVTNAGGSPNAGSQIILRGVSSINPAQGNEPLFIVDGMPISGGASSAAAINPNDIENVTVLKGAAAAALYGQEAANGVIMVTTRQGTVGKIATTVNASLQFDEPTRLPRIQQMFGPGALGFYRPLTGGGWGPPLGEDDKIYDNIGNYFNTGVYQKYDLSMNGGTDKFTAYASANYSSNEGIVPNDYLTRFGINLKGNFNINKYVTANINANITNSTSRGAGGIASVYTWPINDDITDYEVLGWPRFRYLNLPNKEDSPISPLWSRNKDNGINLSTRTLLFGAITAKPIRNLEITGRLSYDLNNYTYDGYSVPRFDDSVILPELNPDSPNYLTNLAAQDKLPYFTQKQLGNISKDLLGNYGYSSSRSEMITASAMATYKLEINKDYTVEMLAGSEMKMRKGLSASMAGRDFIIPGIYSMSNVNEVVKVNDANVNHSERRNAGVYGELRFDYKGLATLSATTRWDWSSTIALRYNPYDYQSLTGGLTFSELFDITNEYFTYGKLRANWAQVGKDVQQPYLFDRKFTQYPTLPDGGYGADPSRSVASNLVPEMTDSWEVGVDLRFFENKTKFDIAYYSTTVANQIVTVRVSPASGYILQTRNEGNLKNHGVEWTLEQLLLKKRNLFWTATLNFGLNRGVVVSLPDDIVEIQGTQYGDIFPTAYLNGSTTAISGKDYLRTPDGTVIVDASGKPRINPTKSVIIGNREPDFLLGLSSNFKYKDFSVSMLLDGRQGGDIMNVTGRGLWSAGQHKALEFYRGRQVVWDGVVQQPDGSFVKNTTPIVLDSRTITESYVGVSSNFIEKGSYLRLSYITLSYDLSKYLKTIKEIKGLRCSVTGSNLFLLTRYTGSDPQINASTGAGGTGGMGIDNYPVPNTRSVNFTVNVNF
jgi:TonB-linked SusC/RagA family outer membrane protein